MSKTVDERVVSMQFDNKNFERNVSTSMSTLDKLKQKLNLTGAAKGLEDINTSANKVNMSGLANGVGTVSAKFSSLQVMAVTALANITNSAVNAGKRIVSALTIDPIKTGFQEYETQINAVQTILANTESKGTTLQQVNSALDTLNTYADKTIYNFTEMTKNIGTFTAAGVDLDTSVSAIQGIANLAAVSGSTSQQASTAMYQLSQALSSGTVKLQDWNSVVNAGMGGQVFQDALKQTADKHGIAIDKMIEKQGSFRETLKTGWLTSEILTETLSHFTMAAEEGTEEWEAYKKSLMESGYTAEQAEEIIKLSNTATDAATKVKTFTQLWDTLKESAQSGWTQSWEIMIGDFEEAKGFLTDVSDRIGAMIGESADARNKMLSEGLSSGWKQLLDAGIADEEGYKETFKSVAKEHGVSVDDMIAAEKKLDDSLSDSEAFQKALKTGFEDGSLKAEYLSESVHKMADEMSNMSAKELKAAGYTQDHVKQIKDLSAGLKDGSVSMDDFVKKISRSSGRENIIQALWNAFDGLMSVITPIKEAFREIFPATTGDQLYSLTERIRDFTAKLKLSDEQSANLKATFKGLFSIVKIGVTAVKAVIGGVANLIGKLTGLGGGILDTTASIGDWISGVAKSVTETNIFAKAINKIVDVLGKVINKFKEFGSAVKSKFEAPGFETFLNILNTIWSGIKKVGMAVIGVAGAIGKALGNAFRNGDMKSLLDLVNGGIITTILLKLKSWVSGFKDLAGEGKSFVQQIKDVLGTVGDSLKVWQDSLKVNMIKNIAIAIAILAASLWVLSGIDPDKLGSALSAITVLFIELIAALKAFDKLSVASKGAGKAAMMMIGMSLAVLILASAMKKLADLDWGQIGKGLTGIAGLIGTLTGAMVALSKFASTSESVFKLSKKGLFSSKSKTQFISIGVAMIAMAAAVKILASACSDLGSMSWSEIAKSLTGVIGLIGAMTGAMIALSKFANSTKKLEISKKGIFSSKSKQQFISLGLTMIAMAAAMKILASIAKDLADMSWSEIAKGLTGVIGMMGAMTGAMIALSKFANSTKKLEISKKGIFSSKSKNQFISIGVAMIAMAAAMKILASAAKDFASMDWGELAKAGAAIAGILLAIVGFIKLIPNDAELISMGISLVIVAASMKVFASAVKDFASMDWGGLAKAGAAMGGILLAIGLFAKLVGGSSSNTIMTNNSLFSSTSNNQLLETSAALLVVSVSMKIFASAMKSFAGLSWEGISKGLISLGAGLAIFIGAAALIQKFKLTTALYSLSGAIALFGLGCLAAGIGITAFAIGFSILTGSIATGATAIVAALHIIIIGILELIPSIIDTLTRAVVALCQVFIQCVPAIGEAIRVFVLEIIKIFVECIPALADGLLKTVVGVLEALVQYTPQIVDLVFDFLIAILEGIARKLPALIQSVVNVFKALFSGVIDALNSMDPEMLIKGILGIGFMSAMMAALAAMAALAPAAMIGVLGFGAVITELAAVLAVLGGLAQIPGLEWLISEGGDFLQTVGTAIGKFLGGIIGGFAQGMSAALPQIGTDLSSFMTNAMPFIMGAKMVDAASLEGVRSLVDIILLLTGANILEGLTSWFTGGSSLTKFGEEIAAFAPYMKTYAETISGVDSETIEASANAAKALTELASTVPNEGGVAAWFAGENSIAKFGSELPVLGAGLLAFSMSVAGINPENITAAASAAKSLTDMASTVPNEGGVAAWFAGENSIANFATQLPILGAGLLGFSLAVAGINPENVTAAANAAKSLADMANVIPNEGGVVAWFTGDNSIASFASQLPLLGAGLLGFSMSLVGINPENIVAGATAAKSLAEMANTIPNEGGVVAWFTGDNSMASFASQLPVLGAGLLGFSTSLVGINPENITSAATAAKTLAEMTSIIPNEGGIKAWFSGESGIANFASQLPTLGAGLLGFSISAMGVLPEVVLNAVTAAKSIVDLTNSIPNEGGIKSWFSGESGIASFATQLPILGGGLLGFSVAATGVNTEAVNSAVEAAKTIVDLTNSIPNEGGVKAWFAGESSISSFASQLPLLGFGLLAFSTAATGVNTEAVTAATSAAKTLAEMTSIIPNEGGIKAWFSGESGIAKFAEGLPTVGKAINGFATGVGEINSANVTAAANAGKTLAEMTETVPKNTSKLKSFGESLEKFSEKLSSYFTNTAAITPESITAANNASDAVQGFGEKVDASAVKSASKAIDDLVKTMKGVSKIKENTSDGFSKALGKLGETNAEALVESFENAHSTIVQAGENLITKAAEGASNKEADFKKAVGAIADGCANAITAKASSFKSAGKDLGQGLINGINAKKQAVYNAAYALGQKAVQGEKDGQKSNSPSKLTAQAGKWLGEGLIIGMEKMLRSVYKSGDELGEAATDTISGAVSTIADFINSDIDAEPVIRPVLDLSDVKSGAGTINGMFSNRTLSVDTRSIGAISASMARIQNGDNSGELLSTMKGLRNDIANMPRNTYTVNGITYDDGSNITNAVESLVRAARIERRT